MVGLLGFFDWRINSEKMYVDNTPELTDEELQQQDFVDNAILTMIETLVPVEKRGAIYEQNIVALFRDILVREYGLNMKEFYPYIEI